MKKSYRIFIFAIFFAVLTASCAEENEYYLSKFSLTEAEEEVILKITNRVSVEEVTQKDIENIKTLAVGGKSVGRRLRSYGTDGFEIDGKKFGYDTEAYGNELSALRIFTSLEELELFLLPTLTDVSFLSELKKLEKLSIVLTDVSDLTPLSAIQPLNYLVSEANPIEKIEFHPENYLQTIRITGASLRDLTQFQSADIGLLSLSITENSVSFSNPEILSKFNKLQSLELGAPDLDDSIIELLPPTLQKLTLSCKKIDLAGLSRFSDLEQLTLVGGSGVDLRPLDVLPKLNSVVLRDVSEPILGEKTKEEGGILKRDRSPYIMYEIIMQQYNDFKN